MEPISWKIHKAKENSTKTIFASLFILFVILIFLFFYGLLWAFIAVLIFFISLNSYFLPITYTLTEEKIVIDKKIYKNEKEWQIFRKYYLTGNGVILSPFSRRNFLDNFRGLHLLLPEDKDAIIEFIENRLAPPDNQADGSNLSNQ
jgi:predicted membrane protein